jgi:hypothetical protein
MADNLAKVDSDKVLGCLRLGWAMAEFRGRQRAKPTTTKAAHRTGVLRKENALPLGAERTDAELAIEAEATLRGLAQKMEVDFDRSTMSNEEAGASGLASLRLTELAKACSHASDHGQWEEVWRNFSSFLYAWDAKIQDELGVASLNQAAAYQLGRGLSEVFWALDSDIAGPDDARSWQFLLGDERRAILSQLLDRLAIYWDPLVAPAVVASLNAWGNLATKANGTMPLGVHESLHEQMLVWQDLILAERDPHSLLSSKPHWELLKSFGEIWAIFWPQLVAGTVSVIVLAVAAALLGSNALHGLGAFLAVLGAFGVTTAGLQASLKDYVHQLLARLRQAAYQDLVSTAVTRLPSEPK